MSDEITKQAATVEEAVDAALDELGVQADAAEFEVVEGPKPGSLAAGPVTVRVWVKEGYLESADAELEPDAEEAMPPEALRLRLDTELPELTEEELDEIADAAVAAIQQILAAFDIQSTIDEYEGDEGEIILDIVGGDLAILIGRHGKTLDALQAVVSAVTSRVVGRRYPVVVDVEGYRGRRREKLEDMARRTADRVNRQQRPVKLRPMSAYERRVIHVVLRGDRRVATASEGEEPFRSVVVSPR